MEEKCYIGGIQRFSTEDGPGIRTTVFIKGCPLSCKWCHNPELIDFDYTLLFNKKKCIGCGTCIKVCLQQAVTMKAGRIVIDKEKCSHCGTCLEMCCSGALHTSSMNMTIEELMKIVRSDKDFYHNSGGGMTLSGGEILSHGDYAIQIAKRAVKEDISVVIETSGYGNFEKLRSLAALSELVLFDLKHMDQARHEKYVGVSCDTIHRNLKELIKIPRMKEKIIIRLPLIHGINDDIENIKAVGRFMMETGLTNIHILPYHSMGISKAHEMGLEQEKYETPSDRCLEEAAAILHNCNIQVEIMGE